MVFCSSAQTPPHVSSRMPALRHTGVDAHLPREPPFTHTGVQSWVLMCHSSTLPYHIRQQNRITSTCDPLCQTVADANPYATWASQWEQAHRRPTLTFCQTGGVQWRPLCCGGVRWRLSRSQAAKQTEDPNWRRKQRSRGHPPLVAPPGSSVPQTPHSWTPGHTLAPWQCQQVNHKPSLHEEGAQQKELPCVS